ncbi:hypothetical protein RB595_003620 [Gaeumannomyces hyphopodioides]
MRPNNVAASRLLLFVSAACAASVQGNMTEAMGRLPSCAVPCFIDSVGLSACPPLNVTCICNDTVVVSSFTLCVKKGCVPPDQLQTARVAKSVCQTSFKAAPDRSNEMQRVSLAMIVLCSSFAVLRLLSRVELRHPSHGRFRIPWMPDAGWDDAYLCLAWTCTVAMGVIVAVPLERLGFGVDFAVLSLRDAADTVYWLYLMTAIYFSTHTFLKAFFIAFYMRIFGRSGTGLRFLGICDLASLLLWSQWLNLIIGLLLLCLSLGQCSPVSYFWTQWVGDHNGHCPVNLTLLFWSQSATNVIMDVWMLVLPLSQILQVKKSRTARLGVAAMFSLGIITTIVSIIRVIEFTCGLANPEGINVTVAIWSITESAVGIVCACLPGLRLFVLVTIPQAWRWLQRSLGGTRIGSHLSCEPSQLARTGASGSQRMRRTVGGSLLEPTIIGKEEQELGAAPYSRIGGDELRPTSRSGVGGKNDDVYPLTDIKPWIERPSSVPLPPSAHRGDTDSASRGSYRRRVTGDFSGIGLPQAPE